MRAQHVNYGGWLLKVIAWDGLMPIVVLLIPEIVERLLPNRRGAVEVTAVVLPIAAFLVRFYVARREINSHQCSRLFRRLQIGVLCVAVFVLLMFDSFFILARAVPQGARFATKTDVVIWIVLIAVYVASMLIAMYPGPAEPLTPEYRDFDTLSDFGLGERDG